MFANLAIGELRVVITRLLSTANLLRLLSPTMLKLRLWLSKSRTRRSRAMFLHYDSKPLYARWLIVASANSLLSALRQLEWRF